MAKKNDVSLSIGADTKKAQTGIQQVTSSLNSMQKAIKKSDLMKLSVAATGLNSSLSIVTKTVDKVKQSINECSEAYNTQIKAETQLEVAAKNNPYIDGAATAALKSYASELQSISTTGDETLMPLMAELVSAGRTQEEVMVIMKAALDASASGAISLDTAVTQLNATYSGTVGTLGKLVPEVKNLTKEQLANGDAIKLVAQSYEGMAEEVAKATGTSQQLSNAIGDLKEELGAPFEKAMGPVRSYFTELITGWTNSLNAKRKYQEAEGAIASGKGSEEDLVNSIEVRKQRVEQVTADYEKQKKIVDDLVTKQENLKKIEGKGSESNAMWQQYKTQQGVQDNQIEKEKEKLNIIIQQLDEERQLLAEREDELKVLQEQNKEASTAAEQQENANKLTEQMNQRDALRESYKQAIAEKQAEIDLRRQNGEQITEEQEAQQLYNVAMSKYMEMYKDPAFDVSLTSTGIWAGQEDQLKQLAEWYKKTQGAAKDYSEELINTCKPAIEQLNDKVTELDELLAMTNFKEGDVEFEWYLEKRKELVDAVTNYTKQKTYETLQTVIGYAEKYLDSFTQIAEAQSDIAKRNAETEKDNYISALNDKYNKGLVSQEEYEKEKASIEKEYAQKEYEAEMWAWNAQLIQIASNTAAAITQALYDPTIPSTALRIAMAGTVGATAAAQLAAAQACVPKAPSFSTGGIVPGRSYTGDRVHANVNSGEVILNQQQAAQTLFAIANGAQISGTGANVEIKNYRGNDTKVTPEISEDGIKIYIRESIGEDLKKMRLNSELKQAQKTQNGIRFIS